MFILKIFPLMHRHSHTHTELKRNHVCMAEADADVELYDICYTIDLYVVVYYKYYIPIFLRNSFWPFNNGSAFLVSRIDFDVFAECWLSKLTQRYDKSTAKEIEKYTEIIWKKKYCTIADSFIFDP